MYLLNLMVRAFFDVRESIVRDTLESIADASSGVPVAIVPIIVGGIALQLYASDQRDFLRPTSDVDLLDPNNRSYEDFAATYGSVLRNSLRKKGYQIALKRGRSKNEVKVMKGQNANAEELFFAHSTRYQPNTFEISRKVFFRQVVNSREIELPYGLGKKVRVIRIEDMIPHKLSRIRYQIGKLQDLSPVEVDPFYSTLTRSAEALDWDAFAGLDLSQWCGSLTSMQNALVTHASDPSSTVKARYTLNKDLYDIGVLGRVIASRPELFNKSYFLNARAEVERAMGFK